MTTRTPEYHTCECGEHVWAPATRWGVVLVSPEDKELLEQFGWHIVNGDRLSAYAASYKYKTLNHRSSYLHRAVRKDVPLRVKIDHENGNGLDCQRGNLRKATQRDNMRNRRPSRNGTSLYLGVHFEPTRYVKSKDKWLVQIRGQRTCRFVDEIDAAICYNYQAAYLYGDFARLNKITKSPHD